MSKNTTYLILELKFFLVKITYSTVYVRIFTKYKVNVVLQKRRKITGVNLVKLGGNSVFSRTVHSAGLLERHYNLGTWGSRLKFL